MGVFDFIKSELIDIIEWTDDSSNLMVYRFPDKDKEVKMGAQLTVRNSQVAVFVNEGKIADIFTPGRYTLTTANMPVLTTLKSWKYGFESPFKVDIYFINTKQFTNQKWGTSNPIMMRDQDFGMLRLRAYGIYSFKVDDAKIFLEELFGTNSTFNTEDISEHLKKMLVSGLADLIAESKIAAIDLSMYYDELNEQAAKKMDVSFKSFGLTLTSFIIENISLPKEVEEAMDKRTSMGVLGNLDQYTKFQAAEAIRDAAQNEGGGLAQAGVGLGAGAALGNIMGQSLNSSQNIQPNQPTIPTIVCPKCHASVSTNSKFCSSCGALLEEEKPLCIKCKKEIAVNSKFCPHCGSPQIKELKCPSCGKKLDPSCKFCDECGQKIE